LLLQHLFNTLLLWVYFSLLAFGFYFASISCRHFNFATGFGYLLGPYIAWTFLSRGIGGIGIALSVASCAVFGLLYHHLSVWLSRRGSREGQLLIISLGIMAIGENSLVMAFGSTSISLWPFAPENILISTSYLAVTIQQLLFLLFGISIITSILLFWRKAIWGIAFRGLVDSRLNLMLRGYNVYALESTATIIGFLLAGAGGILWSLDARVRPSMAMESSLVGVVTFIVGPMLAGGLWGLILASLAMALLKLFFSLFLEGDWSMTVPLILLFTAFLFNKNRVVLRVAGS
jgi:branched-chain amino acid transport system permease protein